jgi:hypothetical protein
MERGFVKQVWYRAIAGVVGLGLMGLSARAIAESGAKAPSPAAPSPTAPSPTVPSSAVSPTAAPYTVLDEFQKPRFQVRSQRLFRDAALPTTPVAFNAADLLFVLKNTRQYFQDYGQQDPVIARAGVLGQQGVTVAAVRSTLDFMIQTLQEDLDQKRPIRLRDPQFLNQHFRAIAWTPYNPANPQQRQVRLTKYAVFSAPGSRQPTRQFNVGLYRLRDTPQAETLRLRYTKQQVVAGIYEPGGKEHGQVEPLAYLTRDGLEEALLQGTMLVRFADGTSAYFNVDQNNGIAFSKGVGLRQQRRYWYFKEVDGIKGYGYASAAKISIRPDVTVAGDVINLGLGRIVVMEHRTGGKRHLNLSIVADTGGAFLPNLYQLDLLAGVFPSRREFDQRVRSLPEFVNAYILIKR